MIREKEGSHCNTRRVKPFRTNCENQIANRMGITLWQLGILWSKVKRETVFSQMQFKLVLERLRDFCLTFLSLSCSMIAWLWLAWVNQRQALCDVVRWKIILYPTYKDWEYHCILCQVMFSDIKKYKKKWPKIMRSFTPHCEYDCIWYLK